MLLLLLAGGAFAQDYEAQPCEPTSELAAELEAGIVTTVTPVGTDFRMVRASSVLAPGSFTPNRDAVERHVTMTNRTTPGATALDAAVADTRSCRYGSTQLLDGDPATAWCEGAVGTGLGEAVLVPLGEGMGIRSGFQKSEALRVANGRPREVEVLLLGPGKAHAVVSSLLTSLPVLGRHTIALQDVSGWQDLPLPKAGPPPEGWRHLAESTSVTIIPSDAPQPPAFVAVRILSVYPGSKYADTCISELGAQ